jgi:hypothetical protein
VTARTPKPSANPLWWLYWNVLWWLYWNLVRTRVTFVFLYRRDVIWLESGLEIALRSRVVEVGFIRIVFDGLAAPAPGRELFASVLRHEPNVAYVKPACKPGEYSEDILYAEPPGIWR